MKLFPRIFQMRLIRNVDWFHSAWLGLWFIVCITFDLLIWRTALRGAWLLLKELGKTFIRWADGTDQLISLWFGTIGRIIFAMFHGYVSYEDVTKAEMLERFAVHRKKVLQEALRNMLKAAQEAERSLESEGK